MSYSVLTIPPFDKQVKRLVKKYPSLKAELAQLITELQSEPDKGTSLGNSCYRFVWPLPRKERASQVAQGSLHI